MLKIESIRITRAAHISRMLHAVVRGSSPESSIDFYELPPLESQMIESVLSRIASIAAGDKTSRAAEWYMLESYLQKFVPCACDAIAEHLESEKAAARASALYHSGGES
jgi:hypothetical protein